MYWYGSRCLDKVDCTFFFPFPVYLQLLLAVLAVLPNVESQECGATISTVEATDTATGTLTLTCHVPPSHRLSEEAFRWEWDEIAPDGSIDSLLPNTTDTTCECVTVSERERERERERAHALFCLFQMQLGYLNILSLCSAIALVSTKLSMKTLKMAPVSTAVSFWSKWRRSGTMS